MQACPKCGAPLRYIPASHTVIRNGGDGVYTLEAEPMTIITERGRPVTGYRIHKCGDNGDASSSESEGGGKKEKAAGG